MSTKKQIKRSCETWEDGHLGRDLNLMPYELARKKNRKIEDALGFKNDSQFDFLKYLDRGI